MKYSIMTLFLQPIYSIISHFISVIVFTAQSLIHGLYFNYSPSKQKFNNFVKEGEVQVQVASDHSLSINFLSFSLSSEKKKPPDRS